jgi:hypothetical protein
LELELELELEFGFKFGSELEFGLLYQDIRRLTENLVNCISHLIPLGAADRITSKPPIGISMRRNNQRIAGRAAAAGAGGF